LSPNLNLYFSISSILFNFKPDPELLKRLNSKATFERADSDVKNPQKNSLSREERIARAQAIMEKNDYMTLTDYVCATNLSRRAASLDLKSLAADLTSGITIRGSHSHKVWVEG